MGERMGQRFEPPQGAEAASVEAEVGVAAGVAVAEGAGEATLVPIPETLAAAHPPLSQSNPEIERQDIFGHRSDNTSSATGQEAGGSLTSNAGLGATLSLPGLNINWPFSQLILAGVKTVEVRSYALGYRNIAQPDVEMWLVETPGNAKAISTGWVLAGGAAVVPRPENAQIVGTVTFSRSDEYETPAAFRADEENHRIAKGGSYDWDGKGKRHAWRVSAIRRLARPVP